MSVPLKMIKWMDMGFISKILLINNIFIRYTSGAVYSGNW